MINKIIQQNYQTWQKLQNFTQLPKNTYILNIYKIIQEII